MTHEKDWTPQRVGSFYCSTACGGGCTWSNYEAATKAAEELSSMLGDGWEPHVWENVGWYYKAISQDGYTKVHSSGDLSRRRYTAFIGNKDSSGGFWAASGNTPEEAISVTRRAGISELLEKAKLLGVEIAIKTK